MPAAQQLEAARAQLEVLSGDIRRTIRTFWRWNKTIRDLQAKVEEEARRPAVPAPDKPRSPSEVGSAEAAQGSPGGAGRHRPSIGRRRRAEEARLKATMADYNSKDKRGADTRIRARGADARLQHAAGNLLEPAPEARRLEARRQSRTSSDRRAVQDSRSGFASGAASTTRNSDWRVLAGGALGGLAVGLLVVGFLEYRDSSFKCEEDVLRVLSTSGAGADSASWSPITKSRARRRLRGRLARGLS